MGGWYFREQLCGKNFSHGVCIRVGEGGYAGRLVKVCKRLPVIRFVEYQVISSRVLQSVWN